MLERERSLAGASNEPFDAMRNEVVDVFALEPQIALAVAEKNAIARLARRAFGAAHDRREKGIDDVGDDQADGRRLAGRRGRARSGSARSRACGSPPRRVVWVSASTPPRPLTTRDTVIAETPARFPTSRSVVGTNAPVS